MAKRYMHHRVPKEFDKLLADVKYEKGLSKNIDIYRELVKDQHKTKNFLNNLFGNKRGSAAFDIGTGGIFILVAITFLFVAAIIQLIFNITFSDWAGVGASTINKIAEDSLSTITGFDIATIILVVGFFFIIFALTYFFDSSPIFFSIFLALSFIMVLVSLPVANGLYDFINSDESIIQDVASRMPATLFFISNWIYVVISYVMAAIVGFGARPSDREDGRL